MALCVTKGLVAELVAGERVPLLEEPTATALLYPNLSLMQLSRHTPIIGEGLEQHCCYHALPASKRMTESDPFTGELTVWIHWNAPSKSSSFLTINLRLRFQPTPSSSMQLIPAVVLTYTPFCHAQPFVQLSASSNINKLRTDRELERPLQCGANRPFLDQVFFSSFSVRTFHSGSFTKWCTFSIMRSGV